MSKLPIFSKFTLTSLSQTYLSSFPSLPPPNPTTPTPPESRAVISGSEPAAAGAADVVRRWRSSSPPRPPAQGADFGEVQVRLLATVSAFPDVGIRIWCGFVMNDCGGNYWEGGRIVWFVSWWCGCMWIRIRCVLCVVVYGDLKIWRV